MARGRGGNDAIRLAIVNAAPADESDGGKAGSTDLRLAKQPLNDVGNGQRLRTRFGRNLNGLGSFGRGGRARQARYLLRRAVKAIGGIGKPRERRLHQRTNGHASLNGSPQAHLRNYFSRTHCVHTRICCPKTRARLQ